MPDHKLNSRQHRFCLNILAGMRPQEAYIKAGYSPDSADCEPYTLQNLPSIAKFIQEHRDRATTVILANSVSETIASPTERKEILTELMRKPNAKNIFHRDLIQAIREANLMDGSYAPSKHLVAKKVQVVITHVKKVRAGGDEG